MAERIPINEKGRPVVKRHYSEKGGHFQRHLYSNLQRGLERLNPDLPIQPRALTALPVSVTEEWRIRRHMPRYGIRDGR